MLTKPIRDFHAHVVPGEEDIPTFMKEKKIFWIEGNESGQQFMRRGEDGKRPVSHPGFFLEPRLERMQENNIDGMCVFNLSQLYANDLAQNLAEDVLTRQNEYNSDLQAQNPNKIISGIVVNPAYPTHAIKEIEKGGKAGLHIVFMCTHYKGEGDKRFTTLGSKPAIREIFEVMNENNLALQIHPYEMENIIDLDDDLWNPWIYGMPFLTGLAHQAITANDYHNIYPNIRFNFAHAGKLSSISYGRHHQGFVGRPDLYKGTEDTISSIGASNIFYDTLTHDPELLAFLIKRQGLAQFTAGLDSLYPLGDFELPSFKPWHTINQAISAGLLTQDDFHLMAYENGMRWIYGDNWENARKLATEM